jgi:four helix bundle protein
MATIRRFEDLRCWQKARELANAIYDLTEQSHFARDYKLRDQIRDAAGSVMHNIAEGFDAGYNVEFIRFLKLARRSASEVQSQLYLALDRKYITREELEEAYNLATQVKQLINALITYLRKHKSTTPSQPNDETMQQTNDSMQRTNKPTNKRSNDETNKR